MYNIEVSSSANKVLKKWKKSNPQLIAKYKKLYKELMAHPRTGIGHPEPLRGGNGITYSRHLSGHDRIIYDIYDDIVTVLVIQIEGHYSDK